VIKFVSDLRQVGGFSPGNLISAINKTDRHDITEILLKVELNYITITPPFQYPYAHLHTYQYHSTHSTFPSTPGTHPLISYY